MQTLFAALSNRIQKSSASEPPSERSSDLLSADKIGRQARPFPQEVSDAPVDDRSKEEKVADENTFDPKNFSI